MQYVYMSGYSTPQNHVVVLQMWLINFDNNIY